MRKTAMIFSGTILVIGCLTLGASFLAAAVLPNIFLVYLTANPVSFSHEMLRPDMTLPYAFSAAEIAAGAAGLIYWGRRAGD